MYEGTDKTKQKLRRNCGYCGRSFVCTQDELIQHVHVCELEKVNKHYGDLSDNGAK